MSQASEHVKWCLNKAKKEIEELEKVRNSRDVINMNCPICNKGELEKVKEDIVQDGIQSEAFRCISCGEEIMDMKQLRFLANEYRKLK